MRIHAPYRSSALCWTGLLCLSALLALAGCDDGEGEPTPAPDSAVGLDGAVDRDAAPDDGVDQGPAADGLVPDGLAPDGMAPDGMAPDGMAPDGMAPDGMAPDGMAPDGGPPPMGDGFTADFEGAGPGWPAPWTISGGVLSATVEDGMGCLVPELTDYSLARMVAPLGLRDAEIVFTVRFSDVANQGVGFYMRSNGGHLALTEPAGSGYAVFIEGFRDDPGIGLWREVDGEEQDIRITFDPALDLRDDVRYRVRFRVTRLGGATDLRARIWPEGTPEPRGWQVEAQDETPGLQDLPLGIAVDSWNNFTPGNPGPAERGPTCIDDVLIRGIAHPLDGIGAPEVAADGLNFTEGPVWNPADGALLFSDIPANVIYRLDGDGPPASFIEPSGNSNGLFFAPDGGLLVCEHAGRVVRYGFDGLPPVVVADAFEGQPLHSPNDVVARSDGTVYFTDPPYGRRGGQPGPLPFIGLFRVAPDGTLTAEYRGALGDRLNGVALSPDEQRLYVADTAGGTLHAWRVMADGALADRELLHDDLPFADGMAVAPDGTLFVTTGRGVVALDGDGNEWGVIELPRQPSNCTLAPDGTLYVTARDVVYRIPTAAPGLRAP